MKKSITAIAPLADSPDGPLRAPAICGRLFHCTAKGQTRRKIAIISVLIRALLIKITDGTTRAEREIRNCGNLL
jgi:hypothetical protein